MDEGKSGIEQREINIILSTPFFSETHGLVNLSKLLCFWQSPVL